MHIAFFLALFITISLLIPYERPSSPWRLFVRGIYLQWFIYVIFSFFKLKKLFRKLFEKNVKLNDPEVWIINVFCGVAIICLAHIATAYTSYIVGALSFSFVLYLWGLFWVLKRRNQANDTVKSNRKKIENQIAKKLINDLDVLMQEKEPFKNSNLKLSDLAKALKISSHTLSQVLNDNLGKNYATYINEYRIKASQKMMQSKSNLTLEAIGYECGFNSKSTFFTTFKKLTNYTPAEFKSKL